MPSIDVRGMSCPQPVLMVKNEIDNIDKNSKFKIITDNNTAMNNIKRFLNSLGIKNIDVEEDDDDIVILINH
ncbi:MAG: sulfurtransferase TusA family protein [Peptostreptococcaceae bacterium]|nr:sulfurtransferase TusA family protein [Peptostreptococcaceae bacterium]